MSKQSQSQSKNKKKKLIIIIVAFLLAAVLVGAALGIYFALTAKNTDFEVKYEINVACEVTGTLRHNGGAEVSPEPIVFDPEDKAKPERKWLSFGKGYRFRSGTDTVSFIYTFKNTDTIDMKVTLIDKALKANIRVVYVVKQGETETAGNPEAGFIVKPDETWSVECTVSIRNPNKNAKYISNDQHVFSWAIVGIE